MEWVAETEPYKQSATSVTFEEGAKLTDSAYEMFFEWNKLVSVDASNLDTSSVTNMYGKARRLSLTATINLQNTDVEKLTASLSLESQTTINVTATAPSASKVTAKLADGTALGVTELGGGKWRVVLTGIAAHQLGDQWNISIDAGGSDWATVEVSALAYANAAMASDAYDFLTRSPTRQSGRPEDRPLKPQTSVASCDSSCEPTGLTSTYGITRYEVCPCSASLRCSGSCAATPVLPNVDF